MTLEQVGNILGVGAQAVHKWEVGKTPVDLDKLHLLAKAYQTTPDALLFDPAEGEMVERMRQAFEVLKNLPSDQADQWLAVGAAMAGAKKPKDGN